MRAPADSTGAVPAHAPRVGGVGGSGLETPALRAYLVEDNRVVRENLIAALEELAPLRVIGSASDERVAVEWLRADMQDCDLMIIDIFLHSGSGLGVLAAARARRP